MKTNLIITVLLFFLMFGKVTAQSDLVYGLNWDMGQVSFTSINISTGEVEFLSDPINNDYFRYGVSDFDPIEKRYLYVRRLADESAGIVSISAQTGEVLNDVLIDLPVVTGSNPYVYISQIGFNWMDGVLYGILQQRENVGEGLIYLVTININTGLIDFISSESIANITTIDSGNSDIDPINRRFIYVTPERIYTIDLDTGEAIYDLSINYPPNSEIQFAANTTYDYQNDILYCLHVVNITDANGVGLGAELRLAKIDPTTGNLTVISNEKISDDGFGSGDCDIDPTNSRFLYVRQDTLHSVNLTTGVELNRVPIQNDNNSFTPFVNLGYDNLAEVPGESIVMSMGEDLTIEPGEVITLNVWLGEEVSYEWNDGNTEAVRNITLPGIYSVTITKDDFVVEGTINIEETTNANDYLTEGISFEINPNPAFDFIVYKIENVTEEKGTLSILDLNNRNLFSTQINESSGEIDIAKLPGGHYFLKYETVTGLKALKKIVVVR
ncbi:MAG: T9SS type A sorting domain-containing protein [Saprospiraceae bacterium]